MRVFSEPSLKEIISGAGFASVQVASENIPEFGVLHDETWSLPIVGRKGRFQPPFVEITEAYARAVRKIALLERQLEDRTQWARALRKENETALADFRTVAAEAKRAADYIKSLEEDLAAERAAFAKLRSGR